jgi:hypothetical protein
MKPDLEVWVLANLVVEQLKNGVRFCFRNIDDATSKAYHTKQEESRTINSSSACNILIMFTDLDLHIHFSIRWRGARALQDEWFQSHVYEHATLQHGTPRPVRLRCALHLDLRDIFESLDLVRNTVRSCQAKYQETLSGHAYRAKLTQSSRSCLHHTQDR